MRRAAPWKNTLVMLALCLLPTAARAQVAANPSGGPRAPVSLASGAGSANERTALSGVVASGTTSASAEITLTGTVVSSVLLTVNTEPVSSPELCEGGTVQAMLTQTARGGRIDFGSAIVPQRPQSVTNGCAVRTTDGAPGLQLIAAVRSTVQVSGHPGAVVTLGRVLPEGDFTNGSVPSYALRFARGNPSVAGWRSQNAGEPVPAQGTTAAVLLESAASGGSVVDQVGIFLPDEVAPGTYRVDLVFTVVPQ